MNLSLLPGTQRVSQPLVKPLMGKRGYVLTLGTCHTLLRLSRLCQSPHWTKLSGKNLSVTLWLPIFVEVLDE